jgi:dynactin complex subunit
MSDDLVKRLREVGDRNGLMYADYDTTVEAADRIEHLEDRCANLLVENGILNNRIEKLEAEVESLQNIRHYGLRHIMRVQEGELPKDEVYGLPLFAEKNKVYPWPAENVELYAYWKRTDK